MTDIDQRSLSKADIDLKYESPIKQLTARK